MAATKKAEGHEPLFHIVKRPAIAWCHAWLIRIGAVIAALLVAGIVTLALTGENPISVYGTMIKSSFGTNRRVWQLLQNIAMLLCVALAVTPAFRMLLEHRRGGSGAHRRTCYRGMHDNARRKGS